MTLTYLLRLEFQFVPLPNTNPVLVGSRWKAYHEALGLDKIVDDSWEVVQKEKHDIIHLLDFPYNGETRRYQLMENKLTNNKYHLWALTCFFLPTDTDRFIDSVRNHGGVPDIAEDAFELEIGAWSTSL